MPVYSSNSTFKLRTYIGRSEYTLQRLNDWESATLASAAKFLRRPDVTVRASCRTNSYVGQTYVTLIVRYHECDDSLDLRTRFNMEQNSLDTLRALLADIPKTQALKGESVLVLAKQLFPEGHDPPHSHTYKWLDLRLKDGAMTEGGGDREDDSKIVQLCVALSDQGSVSDSKAGAFEQ